EEAGKHHHAAQEETLEAGHVHPRKGHVGRADLQRNDVITERREGQGHNGEEHHDGAVHGPEGVVNVRAHYSLRHHFRTQNPLQHHAHHRNRFVGKCDRPTHHEHQAKPEEEEEQCHHSVLDPNHFV